MICKVTVIINNNNNLRENSESNKKPSKYNKNDKKFQVVQEI